MEKTNLASPKQLIIQAIRRSKGLKLEEYSKESFVIRQLSDGKSYELFMHDVLDSMIVRSTDGVITTQVNLREGRKILLTDQWIGFAPHLYQAVLSDFMSRVVTTQDLVNLISAIKLKLKGSTIRDEHETHLLSSLFLSILKGGQKVGFDLSKEKESFKKIIEDR